jgi:hypothetical protein
MRFAMLARIDTAGQELAGFVPAFPGISQSHIGIYAQGQPLLLSLEAILVPPPLSASRRHFEVQPATIEQLDRLLAGIGIPDGSVGQGHLGGNSVSKTA